MGICFGKTKYAAFLLALIPMVGMGCSPSEREVTESVNPAVLNYYIFTQEVFRLRNGVRTAPQERLADYFSKYTQAIAQGQSLANEIAGLKSLRKHQDLMAAMDSSLQTQLAFLQYELQALRALVDYREAEEAIEKLEQQIGGNTLTRNRLQPELDKQVARSQSALRLMESLKPQLQILSQQNLPQMHTYNQMVLERKIVDYCSSEELLALLDWERPQPAVKKKVAAKKASSKKVSTRKKR